MTLDMPFLKQLAPSMKRPLAFSASTLLATVVLLFVGILPERKTIHATDNNLQILNARLTQMRADIANADQQKRKTEEALAERDALIASGVIEPLLGSFAMRGKTLLDPIAQRTGFHIENVRELPPIQLQLPKIHPEQTHCRQPIEFTGQGSYFQITDFITQTESNNPMATLSSLLILAMPNTPENHKAILTFEWPAKGEKAKAPSTKGK